MINAILLTYSEMSFYYLMYPTYDYRLLLRSYNVAKLGNFFVSYLGDLLFFRNDVPFLEPTHLSSVFRYGFILDGFSVYALHRCENTFTFKPYDIKRYDAIFVETKLGGLTTYAGWTLNNIASDYGLWIGFRGYIWSLSYDLSIALDRRLSKAYPFLSVWIFNVAGVETAWFPNSADTLRNDPDIPKKDQVFYTLVGASSGFVYSRSYASFIKIVPMNNFKYNLYYSYHVSFQKPMYLQTSIRAYSQNELSFPKWIVLSLKGGLEYAGIFFQGRYTTNLKPYEEPDRDRELGIYAKLPWKFLEFEYRYRFLKPSRVSEHYIRMRLHASYRILYARAHYDFITSSYMYRIGLRYGKFAIYYHRHVQKVGDFDFYNDFIEGIGITFFADE